MLTIILNVVLVVGSLIVHEWAHVFAVRFMGGEVQRVGFFPLGMMARARRLERLHSWERYVVYAAGPAGCSTSSAGGTGLNTTSRSGS